MTDKVFNAADETQVAARGKKEVAGREREINDIRAVLSTKQGRRFYWRYLSECGVFKTTFTGNSMGNFKEGERNVGLKLMNDLMEAEPQAYITMMTEAKEQELQ